MHFLDAGAHRFDFSSNTTICGDGTICPNPGNQTCCANHQGVTLIQYRHSDIFSRQITDSATYHSDQESIALSTAFISSATPSSNLWTASSTPWSGVSSPSSSISSSTSFSTTTPISFPPRSDDWPAALQSHPSLISSSRNSTRYPISSNISSGAKVGIGVGVAIGATVISILFFLLCRSHQQRRLIEQAAIRHRLPGEPLRAYEKPEMTGVPARTEMNENSPRERPVLELSDNGHIHELYQASHPM